MSTESQPIIGVLALQGAFEEHEKCLEAVGCKTKQIRKAEELEGIDGIILPGGESTAMGLIGTGGSNNLWQSLQEFSMSKPTWGTCAGMILLANKCIGTSAVIENGQSLIGGMDILVCRNYFGSQISSFEMPTPPPPTCTTPDQPYPGVFIRAPAILSVGPGVEVLASVVATPCRQAAAVLCELESKIANGQDVVMMKVVEERKENISSSSCDSLEKDDKRLTEEKKDFADDSIVLPGAADGSNAREVICAVRRGVTLCTSFHPELTKDYRWHEYFATMVIQSKDSFSSGR